MEHIYITQRNIAEEYDMWKDEENGMMNWIFSSRNKQRLAMREFLRLFPVICRKDMSRHFCSPSERIMG